MKKKSSSDLKKEAQEVTKTISTYANGSGHRMPQTRREFLTSGLIAASTRLFPTSLLGLMSQSAWAQNFSCEVKEDLPTFINLQLAGGPAMFANHLAHGGAGSPLDAYGILGVGGGPTMAYHFKNEAPFYAPDGGRAGSGFLRGLKARMGLTLFNEIIGGRGTGAVGTGTVGKTVFIAVACKSIDDSLANKHDLSGLLIKAGLGGGTLPYLLTETTNKSPSANDLGALRFKPAVYPVPSYLLAQSKESIEASLGFKGTLLTNLKAGTATPADLQTQLMTAINNLTKFQAEQMITQPFSSQSRKLAFQLSQCATEKSLKTLSTQGNVSVGYEGDAALSAIWTPTYGAAVAGSFAEPYKNAVGAAIGLAVTSTLKGLSPACTAVIGAYDYHSGQVPNRAASDDKDYYAGQVVANILLTAHSLKKKVFLYISSDGSVSSPVSASTAPDILWRGDYPERGMNYILAYDPAGAVEAKGYSAGSYQDASFQLNHFTKADNEDLVVNPVNPIAAVENQDLAAAAVFANYLSFAKRQDILNSNGLVVARQKLADSMPGSESNIFNYYSRIVG